MRKLRRGRSSGRRVGAGIFSAICLLLLASCGNKGSVSGVQTVATCDVAPPAQVCEIGPIRSPILSRSGGVISIVADYEVKPSEVPTMEAAFDVLLNDQPPALPFFATYFDFSQVAGQISKDLSEKERQDLEKNKALLEIAGGRVFSFIPADTICPGGFGVASCIRSFVQMMDDGVRV